MAIYNQAPFSIDPYTPIPVDAAPCALDEIDPSDTVQQASETYAPEATIDATVDTSAPGYATVTLAPATPFADPFDIFWQWGDGDSETAGDLVQGHPYALPGDYVIGVQISQGGEATIALSLTAGVS